MSKISKERRESRLRRHNRVRKKIHGTAERPRLSLYRSNKHVMLQIIDDDLGKTLVSVSSNEPSLRAKGGATVASASVLGKTIAERAKAAGVTKVVFDRGGYLYHGRVAAVAEAAREAGLEF
ncbi:MAG: 50S ribosomal protein L18 [Ilumatobacteraceae bacterium]